MTSLSDPLPDNDLIDRALRVLDEAEAAGDDEALPSLDELHERAMAAIAAESERSRASESGGIESTGDDD